MTLCLCLSSITCKTSLQSVATTTINDDPSFVIPISRTVWPIDVTLKLGQSVMIEIAHATFSFRQVTGNPQVDSKGLLSGPRGVRIFIQYETSCEEIEAPIQEFPIFNALHNGHTYGISIKDLKVVDGVYQIILNLNQYARL